MVEMPFSTSCGGYVRLSKTAFYERPYNFTGVIKHTGLKDTPKGIWKDRNIGTWKG